MSKPDSKHVVTCAAIVLWDGITKPEQKEDGSFSHNLRIAIPASALELMEVEALAKQALDDSKWKGVLPPGGNWPVQDADVAKFGPRLAGHKAFTVQTKRGVPQVFDNNGAEMSAMQFGRSFYPGAMVSVYMHAYDYDNKQKGIAFGLDGIKVVDNTTPALAVGGGVNPAQVAAAFGVVTSVATTTATGPVMLPKAAGATYAAMIAAGWTDATLIANGMMAAPAAAVAPPPAAIAPPAPAAPPPAPILVAPHPGILTGGPVMLPAANGVPYATYIAGGWTDAQLIAANYMQPPAAAPAPLPPSGSAPPPPAPAPIAAAAPPPPGGKVMLPPANGVPYETYIAGGWTDAQLVQNGYMAA